MTSEYDTSWDLHESEKGTLPKSPEAFGQKYEIWQKRDWMAWLSATLSFPFVATREEDEEDAYAEQGTITAPFRLGHTMEITGIEKEDARLGIVMKATEQGHVGSVPLSDLEVSSKADKNYWPVREYAVWFANR